MVTTNDVLNIVRETRSLLMPNYGNIDEIEIKDDGSPVTRYDRAVESYLRSKLDKLDTNIGFVGEESGGDRTDERFWLCDPIDGTEYYIRGVPMCTVMLALIESGEVTRSVIYDFVNDIAYHATRGKGAFANKKRISVSQRGIGRAFVMLESNIQKDGNLALEAELHVRTKLVKTMSAGYEYVQVATGTHEARICKDPYGQDYDYAPGSLLVTEAGGIVTNIGKQDYDYRNLDHIAANFPTYNALTTWPDAIFPVR